MLAQRLLALAVRLDAGHPVLGGPATVPGRRMPWQPSPPPSHWARRVRRHAPLLLERQRRSTAPTVRARAVATTGAGRPAEGAGADIAGGGTGAITGAVLAGAAVPVPAKETVAGPPRPALPSEPRAVATRTAGTPRPAGGTLSSVGGLVAPMPDQPGGPWSVTADPHRYGPLDGGGSVADGPAPTWPRPPERTDEPSRSAAAPGVRAAAPYPSLPDDAPLWMDMAEGVDADQVDVEHLDRLEREQRGRSWSG